MQSSADGASRRDGTASRDHWQRRTSAARAPRWRCCAPRSSASTSTKVRPVVGDTDTVGYTRPDRRQPRHVRDRHGGRSRPRATSSRQLRRARREDSGSCDPTQVAFATDAACRPRLGARARAAHVRASSPQAIGAHRRPDQSAARRSTPRGAGPGFATHIVRRRGRPRDRQGRRAPLHGDPGRRPAPSTRRTSRARCRAARAGHRLGAQRGVRLRRAAARWRTRASSTTACRSRATCR